jgi:hypothetical protein
VFKRVTQSIVTDIRKVVSANCDVRTETHSALQQCTELNINSNLLQEMTGMNINFQFSINSLTGSYTAWINPLAY